MKLTYNKFPENFHKCVSICDSQIDRIVCTKNTVKFVFSNGFFKMEDGQLIPTKTGHLELSNCNADEFSCYIIKRKATKCGTKLSGSYISLDKLGNLLLKRAKKIEIFLELYDFNSLYWRGVLLPYKKYGLSDYVVIETNGYFQATYFWE